MTPHLAILLKAPRVGLVKTRLAAELGDQSASRIYRRLVERTLIASRASGYPTTIWYTPADAEHELRAWLGVEWDFQPQCPGDLGARLKAAAEAVPAGDGWIGIGVDCPELTDRHLRLAVGALEVCDMVIGPAADGGYYLLGGRTPMADVFSRMPWSTDRLLAATRQRLHDLGASWQELPVLSDLDTAADARALGFVDAHG